MFETMTVKIFEMFLMMLVGMLTYKLDIIDNHTNQKLSALLLMIINPAVIFASYLLPYQAELMQDLVMTFGLSMLTFVISIGVAGVLIHKSHERSEVERFAIIYSNCGFIGIPLVNAILGAKGVFLLTACLTAFNIFAWTHGLIIMTGNASIKNALKQCICQPSTIAIFAGLVVFLLQLPIPKVIAEPVQYIGSMNTPLAMLVSGAGLAAADLRTAVRRWRSYLISFYKLLLLPAVILGLTVAAGLHGEPAMVNLIAVACPTGATVTLFSLRYGKDFCYAAEIFAITTVLSILTLPLVLGVVSQYV